MEEPLTIEEFRAEIRQQFGEKGITPPAHNSATERELYELWLKGKKKIAAKQQ